MPRWSARNVSPISSTLQPKQGGVFARVFASIKRLSVLSRYPCLFLTVGYVLNRSTCSLLLACSSDPQALQQHTHTSHPPHSVLLTRPFVPPTAFRRTDKATPTTSRHSVTPSCAQRLRYRPRYTRGEAPCSSAISAPACVLAPSNS